MSGGFFRGTSAEQDTRFSNKQAKLLKSQKFAPELDHLVDTTKVKMDVMKPWIANKVTELLGFEDEVLINFIYGLLDVKEVNGKEVQICLTGFMEKNTGKFMKELWALLISAQKNTSGVPQQFLDAKEEETRKKKAETDRIRNEIQKTKDKESQDFEQEKSKKLDGGVDAVLEPRLEGTHPFAHLEDEKEIDARNGSRRRCRGTRSRSISKSFSKSRSYSDERRKSGSVSGSSQSRGNSVSSERAHNSPMGKLLSSHKRYSPQGSLSPIRRRSSYSRHRFKSHERHDTHSPARWQRNSASPVRRKRISRSPIRRRHISPSPVQRRSPIPLRCRSRSTRRHRSPYSSRCRSPPCTRRRSPPMRRGSPPMWRRSPSPMHCRSPSSTRYRSPTLMQRRLPSPSRLRSRSPLKRMSSSPVRYRSPSPVRRQHRGSPPILRRSPLSRCRSPIYNRRRSQTPRQQTSSPHDLNSPSSAQHNLLSPARKQSSNQYRRSSVQLHRGSVRSHGKASPAEHEPARNRIQDLPAKSKGHEFVNRTLTSLRSTRSDQKDWNKSHNDVPFCSPSGERSPSSFGSPPVRRDMGTIQNRRPYSSCESPVKRTRTQTLPNGDRGASPRQKERQSHHDSLRTSGEAEEANNDRGDMYQKDESVAKKSGHPPIVCKQEEYSSSSHRKELLFESEKTSGRVIHTDDFHERKSLFPLKTLREDYKTDEKKQCDPEIVKENDGNHWSEATEKSSIKAQQANLGGSTDWDSEGSDKYRVKIKEKRKHRRSCKYKSTSDDFSYDSEEEERKEAKRRRKEEKRRRKEEKRHRREERHRIREERHAEKLQARSTKTVKSLPNYEKNRSEHDISDGECVVKKMSQPNDGDEPETKQQKQLEIELRQKALESLRAKKGICH